jgi:hypothetical protein
VLKYFTVTPSINVTGRGYFSNIDKRFDVDSQAVVIDTIRKFSQLWEYNASVSVSTRVYSFLKLGKNTIRHVVTPQVSFRAQPDFSTQVYGFYGADGTIDSYSPYEQAIYGQPSIGRQGTVSIGLNNNLEAKVRSKRDTTGTGLRKLVLLEVFNINTGYNLAADSLNWQNLAFNARTRLTKKIDLVFNSSYDFYTFDTTSKRRVNRFEYNETGRFLRPINTSLAINANLASGSPKGTPKADDKSAQADEIRRNPNAYIDFNVPWNLNAGLLVSRTFSNNKESQSIILNFNGDISITEKWKVAFMSGYNFVEKDFSFTSIDIYRDLHCWEMRFNWIPFGLRQSYNFSINVKSGMLQDLKLNRRRQWFDIQNQ